jgi:hypothetical protein
MALKCQQFCSYQQYIERQGLPGYTGGSGGNDEFGGEYDELQALQWGGQSLDDLTRGIGIVYVSIGMPPFTADE